MALAASAGQSYSFTFAKNGTFKYHDAMAATHKGSVVVTGAPASMTLTAATTSIVYGDSTSLSGTVSNQLASEPVTLTPQPYGKGAQSVSTTTTQASGTFGFPVSPTISTTYQAQWKTASSPSVKIDVAPRVGFGHSGSLYIAKVTSDLIGTSRPLAIKRG